MDDLPFPPAPYLTRKQLAAELNVSEKTVGRWTRAGMPHEVWGLRLHRYRLDAVHEWLDRRRTEGWR